MYVTEYWDPAIRDQRRKEWQKMVEEAIEVQRKKDEKEKKAAEKAAAKAVKAAAVEVSAEKVAAKAATAAKAACGEAAADDSSVRTKRGRGGTKLPAAKKRRGKEKTVGEELEEGKAVAQ
jgi:membrane-associated HD superfamily phosphohydrolase